MTKTIHTAAPLDASGVPRWDQEADVIVVGFGIAGGSASIEAARGGSEVLVLEQEGRRSTCRRASRPHHSIPRKGNSGQRTGPAFHQRGRLSRPQR
jgi:choline dehydrogenase-like flavoprotein